MKTSRHSLLPLLLAISCIGAVACNQQPAAAEPTASEVDASPVPLPVERASTTGTPTDPGLAPAAGSALAQPETGSTPAGSSWSYGSRPSSSGDVAVVALDSTDGSSTLTFEQHPVTGRAAFLTPPGEVKCPTGCKVSVQIDGGSSEQMRASRPESAPPRLSLRDPKGLWNALKNTRTLTVHYPAASGGASARFDTAGLDTSRLRGWEQQP